jgi:hypothetical protein
MVRIRKSIAAIAGALALASAGSTASAAALLNESFTGVTIDTTGSQITLADGPGANDNLGKWIDLSRWTVSTGGVCASPCTGSYALHTSSTADETNLLYYCISLAGFGVGTVLTVNFDYIISNRDGQFFLAGLNYGQNNLDPFAPWFNADDPAPTDGTRLLDPLLTQTATWAHRTYSYTLTQPYDVIVVGFALGGSSGSRGVDNVLVEAQAVPLPGTLALPGVAALAGAAVRRRPAA